eukprot:2361542-Prorocentrum_lima.AAC.1
MKKTGTHKTWTANSRMVICGGFAPENQALCDSTSTQNVDIGLLRMMLSMTNGRNVFLNAPINKEAV